MSDTEKEQFHTMAKEIAIMKRWLPIFLFLGTVIGFSVKGTLWFDSNVAKKSDMQELSAKVSDLKNTMITYAQSNEDVHIKLHGGVAVNRHSIDSLGNLVAEQRKTAVAWYRTPSGSLGFRPYVN